MFDRLFNVDLGAEGFIPFILAVILIIGMWKIFAKAGWPGFFAIIPILNLYVLVKLAGYGGLTILLFLIPIVNVIFLVFVYLRLNRAFGQDDLFVLGLIFLPFIFFPILGFGDATYSTSRIH